MSTSISSVRSVTSIDLAGIAASLALFSINIWKHWFFESDDIYISLRYARNLVEHGELVWNLGEYNEGYTNFLHLLITSCLMSLGIEGMIAARTVTFTGAALLFAVLVIGLFRIAPSRELAALRALVLVAVGATPALAVWVAGGLETVLLAAFVGVGVLGVISIIQGGFRAGNGALAALGFSLAVLTRMDSAPFIAFSGVAVLTYLQGSFSRRVAAAFVVAGIPGLISLAHMAWRWSYYGELFPLTFYAKVGLELGVRLDSIRSYLLMSSIWSPLLILSIISLPLLIVRSPRPVLLKVLAIPLIAQLGYIVWSGADYMVGSRVFLHMTVPLSFFAAAFAALYWREAGRILLIAGAVGTTVSLVFIPPLKLDAASFVGRIVADYASENWPAGSVVALHTVGAMPYFADDMIYIDMLGLTDPVIAKREDVPLLTPVQLIPGHGKGYGDYVLDREADYIIAGTTEGRSVEQPVFLTDAELAVSEEFARCYQKREVEVPYSDSFAERGPPMPQPLLFTFYERTCGNG